MCNAAAVSPGFNVIAVVDAHNTSNMYIPRPQTRRRDQGYREIAYIAVKATGLDAQDPVEEG